MAISAKVLGDVYVLNSEFRTISNEEGLATRWVRRGVREAGEVGDAGHAGEAEVTRGAGEDGVAWQAGEAKVAGYAGEAEVTRGAGEGGVAG